MIDNLLCYFREGRALKLPRYLYVINYPVIKIKTHKEDREAAERDMESDCAIF